MAAFCFALLLSLVTVRGGSATNGSSGSGIGSGSGPLDDITTTLVLPSIYSPIMMFPTTGPSVISVTETPSITPRTGSSSSIPITQTPSPTLSSTIETPSTGGYSTTLGPSVTETPSITPPTESSSSIPITQTPSPTLSSTIETPSTGGYSTTLGPSVTETLSITPPTESSSSIPITQTPSPTLTVQSRSPAFTPAVSVVEEGEGEGEEVGMPDEWVLFAVCGLGATVFLLLLAVIIAGVCYYRTRRTAKRRRRAVLFSNREMVQIRRNQSPDTTPNHHPAPCGVAKQPQSYDELFSHIQEENLPIIEISELQTYVEALEEDQAMDEYLEVLEMDVQPYTMTASLKCNRSKNRYIDILANEFTRVHLHTPAGHTRYSDYINANYIEGYRKRKEYIAAQGPLEKTGADFWSMVWSEKSAIIVMVTNLVEDERHKCFKYWPSEGVLLAHSLSVVLQDEQILSNYTIRSFKVTLKDQRYEDSGESRVVTQFHFTGWPDHGVPENTESMLEFVRRVRSDIIPSHGPLIIHCSAGVGRTGTFVAIDVMLQRLQQNEPLDIMNWVCRMRAQRGSMVQTSWQYMFIYKALAHAAAAVAIRNSGETSGREEEGSGGEEGGGKGVEENQKTPSQTQVDLEEDDGLMSLPSFSSDDFVDMHVV